MRPVVVVLVIVAAARGQDSAVKVLDDSLADWERRMGRLEGLKATCKLTEIEDSDKAVYTGEVSFMRPNYARLFLKPTADPTNTRKWRNFIADGTDLWDLNHHTKTAVATPQTKGGLDGLVGFVTGKKAGDLKGRYELSVDPGDPKQFNNFYVHLTIRPKAKADMQEFKKAELVLWRNQDNPKFAANYMLPARLWYQQPNGNQVTWEFSDFEEKKFARADFALPKLPAGWTVERAKVPPTVSRPK